MQGGGPHYRAGHSVVPSACWVLRSSLRLQSPSCVQAGLPVGEGPALGAEPLPLLSPSMVVGPLSHPFSLFAFFFSPAR